MRLPPSRSGDYYVIVGNGFAGVLNHVTLAAAGELDGQPPVVHIGGPDPWGAYYPHRMGQWPALLSLPGFPAHAAPDREDEFLLSTAFAENIALAAERLAIHSIPGPLQAIDNSPDGLRLTTPEGVLLAQRLDICGGPGPPRELDAPVSDPGRSITAENFLSLSALPEGVRSYCVLGGGPTSAWCVERALRSGAGEVTWAGFASLQGAYVASGRNDHLRPGRIPNLRCIEGARRVTAVRSTGSGTEVVFEGLPLPVRADCVVVAHGQRRQVSETGSWARLLNPFVRASGPLRDYELVDRMGRTSGLRSPDGRIRVLGAAALNHPLIYDALRGTIPPRGPLRRLYQFDQSLPQQVGRGIALAAALIASVNGYFGLHPNRNHNTMDIDELIEAFGEAEAQRWYGERGQRIHPVLGPDGRYPAMP